MIWPDFVASTRGVGHLTPKKSLGRGAFDQRKGPHGGEFDPQKIKNVKCPGVSPKGGGGWALLDLTHTLFDCFEMFWRLVTKRGLLFREEGQD